MGSLSKIRLPRLRASLLRLVFFCFKVFTSGCLETKKAAYRFTLIQNFTNLKDEPERMPLSCGYLASIATMVQSKPQMALPIIVDKIRIYLTSRRWIRMNYYRVASYLYVFNIAPNFEHLGQVAGCLFRDC